MKTYTIHYSRILGTDLEVEADNVNTALMIAEKRIARISLYAMDFGDDHFEVIDVKENKEVQ